jgi:Domain of unknown function (DUF4268)
MALEADLPAPAAGLPGSASSVKSPTALGRLEPVDVREFWADEARDFTPWLAEDGNLSLLGETLDLELERFKVEEPVGPFRADIVAKDGDGGLVIIENQLGRADHKHLGQLMVYATNREANAVVWIATKITDEYRKVLDWLNDNTPEAIAFYGLEIELWRIGDSPSAPRFNVVCEPNELTKLERGGTSLSEPTETKLLQRDFWTALKDYAGDKGSHLSFRKPRPQHWYNLAVGRSGFQIGLNAKTVVKEVSCELYISGKVSADLAFALLEEQQEEIEKELGPLEWMPLPKKSACRIIQRKQGDIEDQDSWPDLLAWCLERAEAFHAAFSPRVQSLDLDSAEDAATIEDAVSV